MASNVSISLSPRSLARRRGFALIATLSLMALVTILTLGLLMLSVSSTRKSTIGKSREEARANARLALMLAIGELQRTAGPDQRITAPADQVQDSAPRGITGVWKGVQLDSSNPSASKTSDSEFVEWLISTADRSHELIRDPDTVPSPTSAKDSVKLIDKGSLPTAPGANDLLAADIVKILDDEGRKKGGLAFAVMDESVKARANLDPQVSPYGDLGKQAQVGEAVRYGLEGIDALKASGFPWWESSGQDRMISLATGRLLEGEPPVDDFLYDLSAWSRGLLTNSASGGWREDLSVLFEKLPTSYKTTRVYQDSVAASSDSTPYWIQLSDYANLYREVVKGDGGYQIAASLPPNFSPYHPTTKSPTPGAFKEGYPCVPVVTKMQMVFSIIARNCHSGWANSVPNTCGPDYKYMLHVIYSPVVTVYNPYNIPITFSSMKVSFADIPIGLQFYVDNKAQLTNFASLNQMYVWYDGGSNRTKEFNIELVSSLSASSSNSKLVLQPGESKVFGTCVTPNWSWAKDRPGDGNTIFDWRSNRTSSIKLAPGWNSPGVGFDIDWLVPRPLKSASAKMNGVLPLKSTDRVSVSFKPLPSQASRNKFVATTELVTNGKSSPASVIELDYSNVSTLTRFLSDRYQKDITFPVDMEAAVPTTKIYEADGTLFKNYTRVTPFATFNFYNKTTLDSGTAAKPGVCHSPVTYISKIQPRRENPAIHAYEATLLPIRNAGAGNAGAIEIDPRDRGYSFTGNSLGTGVRMAPLNEIPTLPLQSVAQLRHANLAASGHLPSFTYTVGESWANPMIPYSAVSVARGAQGYPYIDHTWLSNTRLWDSTFFSTVCGYDGPAFTNSSASMSEVLKNFLDGTRPLLNSRLAPRIPTDTPPSQLASKLTGDSDLYRKSAAYLWVEGPFNINSTSVEAWKTLLSSLHKTQVDSYDPLNVTSAGQNDDSLSPVPRQRRPAGPAVSSGQSSREDRWRGYHTLTEAEIDKLAKAIVEEVKDRGPFLSLAEFVNRNPSGSKDEALKGPLQTAIDKSGINEMFSDDSRDIPLSEAKADRFAFPEAMAGENAAGAPGFLTQGDVLSMLGCTPTARGDTFRIRVYGESGGKGDRVEARAWCEAIVQRTHDFVDPVDEPTTPIDSLQSQVNETFGRRFEIVSFRWLLADEI